MVTAQGIYKGRLTSRPQQYFQAGLLTQVHLNHTSSQIFSDLCMINPHYSAGHVTELHRLPDSLRFEIAAPENSKLPYWTDIARILIRQGAYVIELTQNCHDQDDLIHLIYIFNICGEDVFPRTTIKLIEPSDISLSNNS